jgi:hypothetical protein
VVPVAAVEEVK